MAKNDYQIAVQNWKRISARAQQFNVPDSAWKEIATRDIDNVLQGHTPMAYNEALDSVRAAINKSPVVNKQADTGGLFQELGNALSDVASIPANFVRGAVDYATTLPQQIADLPSFAANDPATIAKYGGDPSATFNLGDMLRRMTQVPVFSPLVPGIHTLGAVTTPQGRHEIAQHPGYAAVDVLAAAAAAAPHVTAGLNAEPYSATEALQEGKPLKAAVRKVADITPGMDRAEFRSWVDRNAVSSRIIEHIGKPLSRINRSGSNLIGKLHETDLMKGLDQLPKAERDRINVISSHFGGTVPEPTLGGLTAREAFDQLPVDQQELVWKSRKMVEEYAKEDVSGEHLVNLQTGHGTELPYAAESKIVKQHNAVQSASNMLGRDLTKLETLREGVRKATSDLTGRQGKVRSINETAADFAARAPGPVGFSTIRQSADQFITMFRDMDPRQKINLPFGYGQITKDLRALGGDKGLMAKLSDALEANDAKATYKAIHAIRRTFNHSAWDHTQYARVFREYTQHLRDEIVGVGKRGFSHDVAVQKVHSAVAKFKAQEAKLARTKTIADNRFSEYLSGMQTTAHQKYYPLMDELIRRNSTTLAKRVFQQSQWEAVTQKIADSTNFDQLKEAFGPKHQAEVTAIIDDAKRGWGNLIDQGYDPTWLTDVPSHKLTSTVNPKALKERYFKPPEWKDTSFNLGRSMYDVRAGLTATAANRWTEMATRQFIDGHLKPLGNTYSNLIDPYREIARMEQGIYHGERVSQGLANRLFNRDHVKFDPANYGFSPTVVRGLPKDFYIPSGVHKALMTMTESHGIPLIGERSTAMKIFKYAVLTGPRHLAHVTLGGLMFGMGQDPFFLTKLLRAHSMIKDGFFDPAVIQNFEFVAEHAWQIQAGKALGRMGEKIFGAPGRFFQHLEEMTTNTYKVAMMLQKESRGFDREAAMNFAAKTFVDLDNLAPLERAYLKQIMPFYAFTKHLFRYALAYPADHPYATAIINNFARQATEEWNTGLPQTMMNLFSLGSPDASGNVRTIDMRSADPFRSLYSDFTLGGVLSQLNPAFTIPFEIAGVNVLSATPDLYPQLDWDPRTGQFVASHDTTSASYDVLNAFIPEFGAVDHFVGLTDQTRNLARNNPEAFHRQLWSSLNLPLDVSQYNMPYEIARNESRRFKVAQQDVAAALGEGDWGRLRGYDLVPVPKYLQRLAGGPLVSPGALRQAWARMTATAPQGVNPRAVIPRGR